MSKNFPENFPPAAVIGYVERIVKTTYIFRNTRQTSQAKVNAEKHLTDEIMRRDTAHDISYANRKLGRRMSEREREKEKWREEEEEEEEATSPQ
jgi:hypothetical protein